MPTFSNTNDKTAITAINMLTTKITFALADWIREWRKCRDKNPSIDECVKFVQWKLEDYKLSDSDKRIIESILLYESE